MSLKQKALSGVRWTSTSTLITTVVQLIQLIVLAHYLNPSDFGLMAIVSVIIGVSRIFLDLGISAAIIQKQDITHLQLSSLYWVNIFVGFIMFVMVYILAPFLAEFYNEKELIPLVQLLAFSFIISSFGGQYNVLLYKELKFNKIAKISIISVLVSFIVAISLAVNNFGVYSLVYASLAGWIVATFLNIYIGIESHRPSFVYKHSEITSLLSFGFFQTGEKSINYFINQFDVILIGKLLGVEALGIYSIAKNLSMRPLQIFSPLVTNVTFPIMSKVQNDFIRLKVIYLKTITYLSAINFPVYIFLALSAEPLIVTMFGEKWHDSIVILQILSIYGAIRSTEESIPTLLLAGGRADLGFYWSLVRFFIMPLIIYFGSFWGLIGISYSLVILVSILVIPQWKYIIRPLCGANFKEYFLQFLKPFVISSASGIIAYGICFILDIDSLRINAVITAIIMGIFLFLLNIKFNHEFVEAVLDLLRKKKIDKL